MYISYQILSPPQQKFSTLSINLLVTHYDESEGKSERQFSWVKFTTKHFMTCDIAFDGGGAIWV